MMRWTILILGAAAFAAGWLALVWWLDVFAYPDGSILFLMVTVVGLALGVAIWLDRRNRFASAIGILAIMALALGAVDALVFILCGEPVRFCIVGWVLLGPATVALGLFAPAGLVVLAKRETPRSSEPPA